MAAMHGLYSGASFSVEEPEPHTNESFSHSFEERDRDVEIESPKREVHALPPEALVMVGASPYSRRYSSLQRVDFPGHRPSARKINFSR